MQRVYIQDLLVEFKGPHNLRSLEGKTGQDGTSSDNFGLSRARLVRVVAIDVPHHGRVLSIWSSSVEKERKTFRLSGFLAGAFSLYEVEIVQNCIATPKATSRCRLRLPLEYFTQRHVKHIGNLERSLQRGRVFSSLDCGNCLPGYADALPKFSLRHFAIVETKEPYSIANRSVHATCLR